MGATPGPYTWQPHIFAWLVLAAFAGVVVAAHTRLSRSAVHPIPWTGRQRAAFAGGLAIAVVALTWPLADLAAHWSLAALVSQRLILLLAVPPLLLLGMPYDVLRQITRPAWIDGVLARLQHPAVAILTVTVVVVGSMTPALVRAQSTSLAARAALDLVTVLAGLVLWLPVLGRVPGIARLRPVVRFAYLVAQAVIPGFLSFIYIFSNHALYPEFAKSHAAVGLRPLTDQQIAGFISKLTLLLVLLTVGGVVLARAPVTEDEFDLNEPLVWADVEREFERADRRRPTGTAGEPVGANGVPASDGDSPDRRPPHAGGRPDPGLSGHPTTNREPPDSDQPDTSG